MPHILAQISPQRSTQYSKIATALAPVELKLSPLGQFILSIEPIEFGRQEYLKISLSADKMDESILYELANLSMTGSFFNYYETLSSIEGPFLKPIKVSYTNSLPVDFPLTRRYKGKTNEMFTHFLCNIARYSSSFSDCRWKDLRILDPLAGGGTTLFTAMYLGADAAGIEKRSKDVKSTVTFLKQYMKEQNISCKVKEERLKKSINKNWFNIGAADQRCLLVSGDAAEAGYLTTGFKKPHCIVTDLPYGVQHGGDITELLIDAVPEWLSLLLPGGTIVMSWDSSRFSRLEMKGLLEAACEINILDDQPYEMMTHRVDRVIRERDVIVIKKDE